MDNSRAMDTLHALSQETRLKAFRLLMKHMVNGLPAGEIARKLSAPQNTLSTHLGHLVRCGLVSKKRKGREIIYAARIAGVEELVLFLTEGCCDGRPDLCGALVDTWTSPISGNKKMTQLKIYNVLFLCTGNSARSILAEAIMNRYGKGRFKAFSAGSLPAGKVNPFAISLLKNMGYETDGLRSKNWSEFDGENTPRMDFIFTVCDNAAGEVCPVWPGQPMTAHWGIADPAAVTGSDKEKEAAFSDAYNQLLTRIESFNNLPLTTIDRLSLKKQLDQIGDTAQ